MRPWRGVQPPLKHNDYIALPDTAEELFGTIPVFPVPVYPPSVAQWYYLRAIEERLDTDSL
jgi:hypothetical protein